MIKKIKKRDGSIEEFNPDKLNKWAEWASEINGVDWASIALDAVKKCYDECTTSELQGAMISACIDREDEAHMYMAGRLYAGDCYKTVFGDYRDVPSLKDMYYKMILQGLWGNMNYSDEELDYLDAILNHDIDLTYPYTQLFQIKEKYAITDRIANKCFETPQFVFMRVALGAMNNQPKDRRIEDVVAVYEFLSQGILNAPTPYMLYLGTNHRGLASCCVYISDDNIPSLAAGDHIAYMMTCASAGIGGTLLTRSKGDPVRAGTIKHLGKLPYYKYTEAGVCSNKQAGRGGACTMYFSCLDPELGDLLKLRHPTTVDEKKIKDIDYGLAYNYALLKHAALNKDWMLISYFYAKDLWEALYSSDLEEFERLYEIYAASDLPKKFVSARAIVLEFLTNSYEVGRLYEFASDNVNGHTPFKETIYSSNLCTEIALVTKPFADIMDLYSPNSKGEIGLCQLMAICAGRATAKNYQKAAYYALLMIDNAIEIMKYPFPSLDTSAKARRSAGVGITNLAYDLAYRGLTYDSQAGKDYLHRHAEMHSYWLHEASLKLAEEKGLAPWMHKTKYPDGWLPIDTYNKNVDNITSQKLIYDWEDLRSRIVKFGGIRNSILEAHMPCESSSMASNSTNGLYPIRQGVIIKIDGDTKKVFIAPGWDELKYQYQLAWAIEDDHMTDGYAIIQKFSGQSISADYYIKYNSDGSKRQISFKDMFKAIVYRHKMGIKSRYYINSASGAYIPQEKGCDSGACTL
ncbi:ribonucleoside-diphosphate reductase subunit alpha [Candidatus Woesebacteria bacterium]|nr:ribonucleoside-diphosphate reductase subunit alpha [Candidatus Woesebacteria bacterium]